jgi:hypothetical protein
VTDADLEGVSLDKSNHSVVGGQPHSDDERAINESLVNETNLSSKRLRKKGTASADTQKKDEKPDRSERNKAKVATLIISFPPSYPQRGVPTFTLRGAGLASSGSSLRSDLIAEMVSIAKGATQSAENVFATLGVAQSAKFLYDISDCFRCRTLQYWGAKAQTPAPENTAMIGKTTTEGSTKALKWGESDAASDIGLDIDDMVDKEAISADARTSFQSLTNLISDKKSPVSKQKHKQDKKFEQNVEPSSKATEIIEPLAYCVPCPPSSGFAMSSSGLLVTFGGAILLPRPSRAVSDVQSAANNASKDGEKKTWALNIYPKSYADLLLRQREREFYMSEDAINDVAKAKQSTRKQKPSKQSIIHSSSGGSIVDMASNSFSFDGLDEVDILSENYSDDGKSNRSSGIDDSSDADGSNCRESGSNESSPPVCEVPEGKACNSNLM